MNSRKISVDLIVAPGIDKEPSIKVSEWANQQHPLILIDGIHHGTIMSSPPKLLQKLVQKALKVESAAEFSGWIDDALVRTEPARAMVAHWQQFVIRLVDERGDPVKDWNVQLYGGPDAIDTLQQFALDVHPYKRDPSLRCFHVNLDELKPAELNHIELRLIASSGTNLVAYHGAGSERILKDGTAMNPEGKWDARIDLGKALREIKNFELFYPFTTTFVEIRLNREPMPMVGKNNVYWFV